LFAVLWHLAVTATKSAKNSELLRGATVGQIALTPSDRAMMEELIVEAMSVFESRRTRARAPRSALHEAIPLLEREANRDDVLVAPLRERLRDLIDELRKLAAAASPPPPLAKRSKTDENFDELVDRVASCWEWVTRTRFAESERKVEQARAGIDAARHAFAGEMADALAAGRAIPATSSAVKMADAAATDAERTASAVGVARDRLRSDLRGIEIDVSIADLGIIAEVNKLAWPSLEVLVERCEKALAIAIPGFAVLSFLNSSLGAGANERVHIDERGLPFSETQRISAARLKAAQRIPPELQERARALFVSARVFCFPGDFYANANLPKDARAFVDAWRSCREELRRDGKAELPKLPGELD
jgi:hypothetical protein